MRTISSLIGAQVVGRDGVGKPHLVVGLEKHNTLCGHSSGVYYQNNRSAMPQADFHGSFVVI